MCNNEPLETVYKMKYLGVILDPFLKWTDHVDYVIKKFQKHTRVFEKLSHTYKTKL